MSMQQQSEQKIIAEQQAARRTTGSMTRTRKILGIILIIGSLAYMLWSWGSLPSAQACTYVNSIGPATCSSSLSAVQWAVFGFLAGARLLMPAPWIIRWLGGK
jgi:uncharacterized membrane protein